MKRIVPILLFAVLLIAGFLAFRFYKSKQTQVAGETPAAAVAPDSEASDVSEKSEYKTLAATLPIEEMGIELLTYWKKSPALNDEGFLKVEVRDVATQKLVEAPGTLTASVWSLSHSYGIVQPAVIPVLDKESKKPTGVYKISGIYFLAPDQWEVRIYLTKADAKEITETLKVDLGVPPPNPMNDPTSPTYIMMKGMGMDHTVNHNRAKEIAEAKKKRHRESTAKGQPAEESTEHPEGHDHK
jgi:hypothetical protein